jgi:hypothetical protein
MLMAQQTRLAFACLMVLATGLAPAPSGAQGGDPAPVDLTPVDLPFAGFFKRPIGPRGLEPSELLLKADGQRVRVQGYMVAREQATPGRFLLTPRPVRLSEHADGEADDLPPATVTVVLDPSHSTSIVAHQAGAVALTGRLQLGRLEEAEGRVSWFRLLLDADAMAPHQRPRARSDAHILP